MVEEQTKKKAKKKKPRVIHALGNMKWGFAPGKNNAINVEALQNKCEESRLSTFRANHIVIAGDRDHAMKLRVGGERINSFVLKLFLGERYFRLWRFL